MSKLTKSSMKSLGTRCSVEMKEKIEKLVPEKYISVSEFVYKAVREKLDREGT